jgi:hypothetical protein
MLLTGARGLSPSKEKQSSQAIKDMFASSLIANYGRVENK